MHSPERFMAPRSWTLSFEVIKANVDRVLQQKGAA